MTDHKQPRRCEPCRQTGAIHCSDPENCGGPWDKRNAAATNESLWKRFQNWRERTGFFMDGHDGGM